MSNKKEHVRRPKKNSWEYIQAKKKKRGSFGFTIPNGKVFRFKNIEERSLFIKYMNKMKLPFFQFLMEIKQLAEKIKSGLITE